MAGTHLGRRVTAWHPHSFRIVTVPLGNPAGRRAFQTCMRHLFLSRVAAAACSSVALVAVLAPAAHAEPTPSPSASTYPCTKPTANFFDFTPTRLAAGDTVHISGSIEDLCYESQSPQTLTISVKRAQDADPVEVATATSDAHGHFTADLVVNETETLYVRRNDNNNPLYYAAGLGRPAVVQVDRVSGSCAGVVTLASPTAVHLGDDVTLVAQRSDTSTVTINARRRGASTFAPLATAGPNADGGFSAHLQANDDYAVYAAGGRCDSPPRLIQIRPTISGPATVRRGTSVTLTVTGVPAAPVAVYFHKAGSTGYSKRRISTLASNGVYTTTFLADSDYRYYALVGNDRRMSNGGLTQAR
jgi:hypothetical protein